MSKAATNKDRRKLEALPYAPEGCPINVGKQKCGETVGLDIIMDFHKLYQEKMSEIDVSAGGDSLQEKVNLQEQWIEDLTAQNKLLARVIEELESETIGRVQKLEDKLNNAVKSFGEDGSRAMEEKEKKIEKLKDDLKALPAAEKDLKKLDEESERLKQEMEEMRLALTEEIAKKHDTISLLHRTIYHLEEKNCETLKETSIKDDIIKELRKELKRSRQKIVNSKKEEEKPRTQTAEKCVNTADTEVLRITHSKEPQENKNSTVIFMHRVDKDEEKILKSKFDSSDSSECGLSEKVFDSGQVHTCKSENDMKMINLMRPTKERSILTKIRKHIGNEHGKPDQVRSTKRLLIPKHIPVKTYINNIEYSKE